MFGWAKFVQGLVTLANWATRWLERQEIKQDGINQQNVANDKAERNLEKNVRAIDNAFDANADRMSKLFGNTEPPAGSSKR